MVAAACFLRLQDIIAALAGLGIHAEAMTTRKPTLDDVYLQLTGSRLAA